MEDVKIIEGGLAVDDRGSLSFANNFNFSGVKRFYKIENFSTECIRAWHGHLKEGKYVFVSKGSAIVGAVSMDGNTTAPSKTNKVNRFVLSESKPTIVYIPPGYANGFRALVTGTQIFFFSTGTLEEAKGDDYRFAADYWGKQIWEVENR